MLEISTGVSGGFAAGAFAVGDAGLTAAIVGVEGAFVDMVGLI